MLRTWICFPSANAWTSGRKSLAFDAFMLALDAPCKTSVDNLPRHVFKIVVFLHAPDFPNPGREFDWPMLFVLDGRGFGELEQSALSDFDQLRFVVFNDVRVTRFAVRQNEAV